MCFIDFDNNELAGGTTLIQKTINPYWNDTVGLGSIVCYTKSKKQNDRNGNQFVDKEPFINKRKPLSMTIVKGVLNNGEHTLIPVMVKMIHSAVWDSKRFIFNDGQPLHLVKFVSAMKTFHVNI